MAADSEPVDLSEFDQLLDKGCLLDFGEESESRPLPEFLAHWLISSGFTTATVRSSVIRLSGKSS